MAMAKLEVVVPVFCRVWGQRRASEKLKGTSGHIISAWHIPDICIRGFMGRVGERASARLQQRAWSRKLGRDRTARRNGPGRAMVFALG